ncbi:MAG: DUF1858 domain-containing protein [Vallitaleaceae bacterium]|nr:DUF1858 domain-containing protein [Vallitaleaceae bacterium]
MDQIIIASNTSVYELVNKYPQILEIMVDLGFKDIVKPGILQTMGKVMTLEKGAKMKKIAWEEIVNKFEAKGFSIV